MTETCALCATADAGRRLYPPGEWVTHLREERDLDPLEGALAVPLCRSCHDRVDTLRRSFRTLHALEADRRASTRDRIETVLDRLDPDFVVDEPRSSTDAVRRFYGEKAREE